MTPDQLASIHAEAMVTPAPWHAGNFHKLLKSKGVFLVTVPENAGFALGRVVLDEAELLTLAITPAYQRSGFGQHCLAGFESAARDRKAAVAYLDVACSNHAARALYTKHGWQETGKRSGYYRSPEGPIDAILMRKTLVPA